MTSLYGVYTIVKKGKTIKKWEIEAKKKIDKRRRVCLDMKKREQWAQQIKNRDTDSCIIYAKKFA